jgi:hypothetical protein
VYVLSWAQVADSARTFAAVLPYARSVTTGTQATAFGTIINDGSATATSCTLAAPPGFPAAFTFQTTDAANQLTGTPNTPVDIGSKAAQGFVFGLTPGQDYNAAEVAIVFSCTNAPTTVSVPGLNTLLLSASAAQTPDMIAIGATVSNDGIVNVPGNNGTGFFAAAVVNIGAIGSITAIADDGGKGLPLTLSLCQTNPATGACVNPATPGSSATFTTQPNEIATFTVFVTGTGNIPFDPANNRLFLRFNTADGISRGATNVAVRTGPP